MRTFESMPRSRSSRTASSFWKEQASETRPGNESTQKRRISSALMDSTSFGNCRLVAKEHLLQRVATQPEAKRLERNHLVGWDVPEVDRWAELLDEPRLRCL